MTLRILARWVVLAATAALIGCLPNRGTPVFVDGSTGNYWSGKGVLVEVSPDQTQCRVVVYDGTLIRRDRWLSCDAVHPRQS